MSIANCMILFWRAGASRVRARGNERAWARGNKWLVAFISVLAFSGAAISLTGPVRAQTLDARQPRASAAAAAGAAAQNQRGQQDQSGQSREITGVIATIKPIHALVASIMRGAGRPRLLVKGGGSPHSYALKPSDARALHHGALLFQVSDRFEVFLSRTRRSLPRSLKVVSLMRAPGLTLLALRSAGHFHVPDHAGETGSAMSAGSSSDAGINSRRQLAPGTGRPLKNDLAQLDQHIWLSPRNGAAMARYIADVLSAAYPATSTLFKANAQALIARLQALDRELAARLRPLTGTPYLVFHDAYHYFEHHYGLTPAGAVTLSPDQRPGAKRISTLRALVRRKAIKCVFTEPQFQPRLVQAIIEGSGARRADLDPLGAALTAGPQLYETLLRQMAVRLERCLGAAKQ